MKKTVVIMFLSLIALSASAENKTIPYKANGESKNVCIMDNDMVYVYVNGGARSTVEPYFILEGKKQIYNFRNSIIALKKEYVELKKDPSNGTGDDSIHDVSVKFSPFNVGWQSVNGTQFIGSSKSLAPIYHVRIDGENLVYEIKYWGKVGDKNDYKIKQLCVLLFISEDEIQSLIDALPNVEPDPIPVEETAASKAAKSTSPDRQPGESYAAYVERMARLGYGIK